MNRNLTLWVSLLTVSGAFLALATPAAATHSPTASVDRATIYETGSLRQFVSANFTGAYTPDAGEQVVTITWVFGDGTTASGFVPPAKSFKDAGSYAVRLEVLVEKDGVVSTKAKTVPITVQNSAPTATHNVPAITSGQPLAVNFDLRDNQGIASATLFYRHPGDANFIAQTMTRSGARNAQTGVETWGYSIPASYLTAPVEYYVEARDVTANSNAAINARFPATGTYTASAGANDAQPPTITLDLSAPRTVQYGVGLPITMGLADASGVASAKFFYRKTGTTQFTEVAVNTTTKTVAMPWSAISTGGTYNWYVTAADTRGNSGTLNTAASPGTLTVVIGPKVTVNVPSTLQKLSAGSQIAVTGFAHDDKAGVTATLAYNDGSGWKPASPLQMGAVSGTAPVNRSLAGFIPLPSGEFAARNILFFVNATDTDNNAASTGMLSVRVVTDATAPTISNESPKGPIKAIADVKADWSDATAVDKGTAVVKIGGTAVPAAQVNTTATGFRIAATSAVLAALAEGTHNVVVTVADTSGNSAEKSWSFVLDKTAPTVSGVGLDGQLGVRPVIKVTFADSGSGVVASTAKLTIDGTAQTITATATGFEFTPTADLAGGKRNVVVTVEDAAGNKATFTKEIEVKVPTPEQAKSKGFFGIPGFEAVAALAALGAALVVLRRRN